MFFQPRKPRIPAAAAALLPVIAVWAPTDGALVATVSAQLSGEAVSPRFRQPDTRVESGADALVAGAGRSVQCCLYSMWRMPMKLAHLEASKSPVFETRPLGDRRKSS